MVALLARLAGTFPVVLIFLGFAVAQASEVPNRQAVGRKLLQIVTLAEDTKNEYFDGGHNGLSDAGLPYDIPDSRRFCGLDSSGNCHFEGYLEVIGVFAFPGIALAVLSILGLLFFVILRQGCNWFGGRSPSKGCFFGGNKGEAGVCCGDDKDNFEGYSKGAVIALIVLCVIFGLGLIFTPIIGLVGNNWVRPGLDSVFDTGDETIVHIVNTALTIRNKLAALPYVDASAEINDAIATFRGYQTDLTDIHDQATYYDTIRFGVTIGLLVVPMLIGSMGAMLAIRRNHRLSLCMAVFCFLASFVTWLAFGVHMPIGLVMYDACREAEVYLADPTAANAFGTTLQCTNGTLSTLHPLKTNAQDGIFEAQDRICFAADSVCSNLTVCGGTCTRANAAVYNFTMIEDFKFSCDGQCNFTAPPTGCVSGNVSKCELVNRTFGECAVGCANPILRNASDLILYNLGVSVAYQNILTQDVTPIISCSFVQGVVSSLHGAVCDDIAYGVDLVATGFLVPACLLVPFTFFMVMGRKRFRSDMRKSSRSDGETAKPPKTPKTKTWKDIEMADIEMREPPLQTSSARDLTLNGSTGGRGSADSERRPNLVPDTFTATPAAYSDSYRTRTPSQPGLEAAPPAVPDFSSTDYTSAKSYDSSTENAAAETRLERAPTDPWSSVSANMSSLLANLNLEPPSSPNAAQRPAAYDVGSIRSVHSEGGWHSDSRSDSHDDYEPPVLGRASSGYRPPEFASAPYVAASSPDSTYIALRRKDPGSDSDSSKSSDSDSSSSSSSSDSGTDDR